MVVSWDFAVSWLAAGVVVAHLMGAGGRGARRGRDDGFNREERPGSGRLRGNHTGVTPGTRALFAVQHNGWDHALKGTADGTGLAGHAGAVLPREAADQAGLTGGLSAALCRKGASPLLDRGVVLVLLAAAIALGATSMSDIAVPPAPGPGAGGGAERPDGPPGAGPGRRPGHAGPDRPRPGEGPHARVDADRGHARGVPVAGHRREGTDGVAGDRHGRHADHRAQTRKERLPPGRRATASTRWRRGVPIRHEHDGHELRDADPDTLRYRIWHIPARLAHHARQRILKISPGWPWKDAFLTCRQRLCVLPAPS